MTQPTTSKSMQAIGWLAIAIVAVATSCTPGSILKSPAPTPAGASFGTAPISAIALDDYASGGTLTVPPGTEFGIQLAGGGWSIPAPPSYEPVQLVRGPEEWDPDLGFIGPGNCDSASPCGGTGAIFRTKEPGYGDVIAIAGDAYVFDLHVVVKAGTGISLDLQARPIPNEDLGTSVTMPVGSMVNVHLIGNWAAPVPDAIDIKLFGEDHLSTSGVITEVAAVHVLDESIYSYAITGKGGYAYDFAYLDPSIYAQGYTIGFDIR